jgi:hypothetical protein
MAQAVGGVPGMEQEGYFLPSQAPSMGKTSPADSRWEGFGWLCLSLSIFGFQNILIQENKNSSKINPLFHVCSWSPQQTGFSLKMK